MEEDNDFGFTAMDESDLVDNGKYQDMIAENHQTVEKYKERLTQVENIILPFLNSLLKTADQPIIKWPNRKPILEQQIQKILKLTRDPI